MKYLKGSCSYGQEKEHDDGVENGNFGIKILDHVFNDPQARTSTCTG